MQKLVAECRQPRDLATVLCLLDSGCRATEVLNLNVGDVDRRGGQVRVREGKGRKDRITFLGTRARKTLMKYLVIRGLTEPADPLWVSEETKDRLTDSGLRQLLECLGQRAGVANCHAHTFRRTCALWSLRSGMTIYALQQIMGHSDLAMLRRYLASVEEDLEDAHRRHGAVDSVPYPHSASLLTHAYGCSSVAG